MEPDDNGLYDSLVMVTVGTDGTRATVVVRPAEIDQEVAAARYAAMVSGQSSEI